MPEIDLDPYETPPKPTYAEEMAAKGVGHIKGGQTWNTRDQVAVHRDESGKPVAQTVTDQNGHEVTEHASGRQDVNINLR